MNTGKSSLINQQSEFIGKSIILNLMSKNSVSYLLNRRWIPHVLAWVLFSMIFLLGIVGTGTLEEAAMIISIIVLPSIPATYINFYLIEKFFKQSRYGYYLLLGLANILLFGNLLEYAGENWIFKDEADTIIAGEITLGSILMVATGIRYFYQSFETRSRLAEIEAKNAKAELESLKSKVNPHFLFNSLNNVYGLLMDKESVAANSVMQLSSLIRYMIYTSENSTVDVQKEVEFLKDYVSMEKLRLGSKCQINFEVEGNFNGKTIAPFLLIPFVENAFKHGSFATIDSSYVKIKIEETNEGLLLNVENSVKKKSSSESGIGIQNAQRRLELLMPNRYDLEIEPGESNYQVNLNLAL